MEDSREASVHSDGRPADPPAPPTPRPTAEAAPAVAGFLKTLGHNWVLSLMNKVALGFLTINSIVAAYHARSDPWTFAFVVTAYAALMLFFWSLRAYEAAPPAGKERMKVIVFALAAFLNFIFAYKVSSMVPFGFALVIWVLAGTTTTLGFYFGFFTEGYNVNAEIGKPEGTKMTGKNQPL